MNLVKLAEEYIVADELEGLLVKQKIDLLLKELAKKEEWELILKVLDQLEENNSKAYYCKKDDLSADDIFTNEFSEGSSIPLEHILKLSNHNDWLDIIYSDSPNNLYQLTDDPYLIYGIRKLTDKQREVLYLRAIKGFSNQEIAELWETTDRNIRKHFDKAIETLQTVLWETELEKDYKENVEIIALIEIMEMIK